MIKIEQIEVRQRTVATSEKCVSRTHMLFAQKAMPPKLSARGAAADRLPNRFAFVIMLCDGVLSALIVNILIILHDGGLFNPFFYCFDNKTQKSSYQSSPKT